MRQCRTCLQILDDDQFYTRQVRCKACVCAARKVYAAANHERLHAWKTEFNARPENIAARKEFNARPENIAVRKEFNARPENIAARKERNKQPHVLAAKRANSKLRHAQLRREIVQAYGGACACCGEDVPEFLTIDHIYNDGAAERKALGGASGVHLYIRLKKAGYPRDRYQLLCYNCNCARYRCGGACPHVTNQPKEKVA